jgi:hypothetical protein
MANLPDPVVRDFDVNLIDWPWAIATAALRVRIRPMPLLHGYLLEAYLSDHPSLTPAVRMAGNALIELHALLDPDKGAMGVEMERLAQMQRARKARNTIATATRPQMQARESEMGQHYAEALESLLLELLEVRGLHFVQAMGHAVRD